MKIIKTNKAPGAIGPYSQAIMATNGMLFVSGQLGINPATGNLGTTFEEQVKLCLANLKAILDEAKLKKEDVLKTTVYIKDLGNFGIFNDLYEGFFENHKPARTTIEISKLPKDGLIEVELIASK